MPINNLKTFQIFSYNITELKTNSRKLIYCICDSCDKSFTRMMMIFSRSKISETYCLECIKLRSSKFLKLKNVYNPSSKKYTCNENYFAEKSLQACYWAGFIAADGCITTKKNNLLSILLSSKDEKHLTNFKENINYDGVLESKIVENKYLMSHLRITSQKICDDLASIFNIYPRKSLTHEPPVGLTEEQELAFIIGYIDGDGCIGIIKNIKSKLGYFLNRKYPIFLDICGTQNFLEWIKLKLKISSNIYKTNTKINSLKTAGKNCYQILNNLNSININKLDRKWKIFTNLVIQDKNK